MMNLLTKIYSHIKTMFGRSYLRLNNIKKRDNSIYCEFNEILCVNGRLVSFDIEEIAKNKNLQKSISPDMLFLIGTIYGKHQDSLKEFKAKIIDIVNQTITLENALEKIKIKIVDLLGDEVLLQQINQLDILKIFFQYAYNIGYNTCSLLSEEQDAIEKINTFQLEHECDNVINLKR